MADDMIAVVAGIPDKNAMGLRASSAPGAAHSELPDVGNEEPEPREFPFVGKTTGRDYDAVPEQALPSPGARQLSPHSPLWISSSHLSPRVAPMPAVAAYGVS